MLAISDVVTGPFLVQDGVMLSLVHRYTDSCTRPCQYDLVLLTCLTNSSPVPSRDRLMATTTISAIVIVRFRRRPIQTSWNTNWARMSLSLGNPAGGPASRPG